MQLRWGFRILAMLFTVLMAPKMTGSCAAEYIDDWFNQKVYVGPNYYRGSERSYGMAGSFSHRWNNGSDYVAGITPPKWNIGCGGIDLFMGGFHFMEFEYLVERFQQIMGPAAEAYAFDIALTTLSETFGSSVKSFTSIIDKLNQLQYSDCESQKVIEAVLTKGYHPKKKNVDLKQAISEHSLLNGLSDLYNEVANFGEDQSAENAAQALGAPIAAMVVDCPQDIRDVFFTTGMLLDNIVNKIGQPYNTQYSALLRGLIGDMYINVSGAQIQTRLIDRCGDNPEPKELRINDFLDGSIFKKEPNGNCVAVNNLSIQGSNYSSMHEYLLVVLTGAVNSKRTGSAMGQDQIALMAQTPLLEEGINYLIMQMGNDVTNEEIARHFVRFAGIAIIYNMVSDFTSRMGQAVDKACDIYDNTGGTSSGNNQSRCQKEIAGSVRAQLEVLVEKASDVGYSIFDDYSLATQEMHANIQTSEKLREGIEKVRARIAGKMQGNQAQSGGKGGVQ